MNKDPAWHIVICYGDAAAGFFVRTVHIQCKRYSTESASRKTGIQIIKNPAFRRIDSIDSRDMYAAFACIYE